MGYFEEQLRQQATATRNAENRARGAAVFGSATSQGQGFIEWPDLIEFGLTFVQPPWVSCGHSLDADSIRHDLDLEDDADLPPLLISGYVTEWERDEHGFWTGAYVGATVHFDTMAVPADFQVEVIHMFRFEGVAMKDVPVTLPNP